MVASERTPILRDNVSVASSSRSIASNRSSMVPRNLAVNEEGLTRIGCFFGGIIDDYKRRLPHYASDITDGLTLKTISSSLFMFFATFFSTVALGVIIQDNTDKKIGTEEYLIMNSVAGMLHALFGCQPMLVLRPTGPITAIITTLHSLSKTFDVDFHQYLGATGIFVGIYMIIVAGFEMTRWIKYLTRYTHEIFAFFVCSIYIHDGIADIVKNFHVGDSDAVKKSFYLLLLSMCTFGISMVLNFATSWKIFTPRIRELITDYAVTIGVFVTIGISYTSMFGSHISVDRVEMPGSILEPTETGRKWLVDFSGVDWWFFPLAAGSALPIVFFFYMDQNVSSLYTQLPEMQCEKGSYYHSSFLCMGAFNIFAPSLGLPFVTGSLPHSPQFVRSVTAFNEDGSVKKNYENRLAPFLMYLMIGIPTTIPSVLEKIPKACIDGILIFVGVAGLLDTQLYERLGCFFKTASTMPARYSSIAVSDVHKWTLSQLFLLALCWGVNLSPAALLFSVIVVSIVPTRKYLIPSLFSTETRDEVVRVLDSAHDGNEVAPINEQA
eukprot:TRINITY_DN3312_c0_g1_i3.p1 TRINITY_DN3312_c0_g1~~TRINITY_DN3312_c0_g1_i3.p1  ORF type:complete len:552 (+),score=62.18 TRINITY_DN3312_c0_g1_i3:35-1690(+)